MKALRFVGAVTLGVLALIYLAALLAVPVLFVLMFWANAYAWSSATMIACLFVTSVVVAALGFWIGDEW